MGLHNPLARQPESYHKKKEYQFKSTLGEGTFGIVRSAVWKAADPPIGVAVKVISKRILKGHDEVVQGEMDVLKVRARSSLGDLKAIYADRLLSHVSRRSHRSHRTPLRASINRTSSSFSTGSSQKTR